MARRLEETRQCRRLLSGRKQETARLQQLAPVLDGWRLLVARRGIVGTLSIVSAAHHRDLAPQASLQGVRPSAVGGQTRLLRRPGSGVPAEHLETDVRTRMGIAVADPAWRPQQLQEAWAPEDPALAKKLYKQRAKLRGVPKNHPDIAMAGSSDGPDIWA